MPPRLVLRAPRERQQEVRQLSQCDTRADTGQRYGQQFRQFQWFQKAHHYMKFVFDIQSWRLPHRHWI